MGEREEKADIRASDNQGDICNCCDTPHDGTAQESAFSLGIYETEVVIIIQGMTNQMFYKSMTSLADHKVWQDVYHVPFGSKMLYVKFTMDPTGHLVLSFKER